MTAHVYFPADPSVGIFSYGYEMEIPDFEEEWREDTRKKIKALYDELDGEFSCNVIFEGEIED